jgi:hypothetical protein
MNFLELPKDLINLLMNKYFHPADALYCLMTCKSLLSIFPDKKWLEALRIKVLKQIAYEKQIEAIGNKKVCDVCNQFIPITSMKKHLEKHQIRNTAPIMRPPMMLKCPLCEAPYPERSPHTRKTCPMKIIRCLEYYEYEHQLTKSYPWAELICDKHEGFRGEMKNHSCSYKCKECSVLFNPVLGDPNGFVLHLKLHHGNDSSFLRK